MSNTVRVVWDDIIIAEAPADKIIHVEGNAYFPADNVNATYLSDSDYTTVCGWKGTARYKHVIAGDKKPLQNTVWYYPDPKPNAAHIKGHYAFYRTDLKIVQ